jgi:hypothetical protein
MHELLERRWVPVGVTHSDKPLLPEVIAMLIRMTAGNFRLLTRLLTQIERVLEVNQLHSLGISNYLNAHRGREAQNDTSTSSDSNSYRLPC